MQDKNILLISVGYENNQSANTDVGIDDVTENAVGNVAEHISAKYCADDDTAKPIEIVGDDCHGEESVVGSYESHYQIPNQEVCLRHRHIMLF